VTERDLYEVLGIRRAATVAEIRRAYQKRARQLHPDLNPGDSVAAERFHVLLGAFEILSDPPRRADYDRGGVSSESPPPSAEVGFEGFDFSPEGRPGRVGFRELFDGVLRQPRAGSRGKPSPGEDLEQSTTVSFAESLSGTRRRVQLVRQDECPICRGAAEVAFGPVPCPRCKGAGQVRAKRRHMIFSRGCSECGATGVIDRRPCNRCRGDGRLMQSEWIEVEIPPGVSDGSRVRIPACGNAGRRGGPAGDFVLVVNVEEHPFFRREGNDLHCEVPVTIAEAAIGGHIEVPTPGSPVTIELPAGTQTGQRFRLRKRGAPILGGKGLGDLYVEVRVWVPTVTDDSSCELLQELARRNPHNPRQDLIQKASTEMEH
jgi:molecular chaperone DnaJ